MLGAYQQHVESQLEEIRGAGLWKPERVLDSPQRPRSPAAWRAGCGGAVRQ